MLHCASFYAGLSPPTLLTPPKPILPTNRIIQRGKLYFNNASILRGQISILRDFVPSNVQSIHHSQENALRSKWGYFRQYIADKTPILYMAKESIYMIYYFVSTISHFVDTFCPFIDILTLFHI